jgi:hypothetical protein
MKSRISALAVASAMVFVAHAANADSHIEPIKKVLPGIQAAIVQADLVQALRASNEQRKNFSQGDIDKMEETWQAEVDGDKHPLVDSVVENPLAARMREVIESNGDVVTEIGVIDATGLSIAQSSANSDIWQGEEVKFTKTFPAGPDAVFIDEVEFDGSTQSIQSQANFTVADPETGKAIGSVTVGINVDALQ